MSLDDTKTTGMDVDNSNGDGHDTVKESDLRQQAGGHAGGEGTVTMNQPLAGAWELHEQIGAVVCAGTLRALRKEDGETDEADATEECMQCLEYCRHVGLGLIRNNPCLEAAMKLRDVKAAANARGNDLAMIQGELQGSLRAADKLSARIAELTGELVSVSAENAVLVKDKDRALDERDDADECTAKWKRRVDELEAELARVDDTRTRQRRTPLNAGAGERHIGPSSGHNTDVPRTPTNMRSSGNTISTNGHPSPAPSGSEDVQMSEPAEGGGAREWGNLRGIPKYSTEYPINDSMQIPPSRAQDFAHSNGEYQTIEDWAAAHKFAHATRCWPVGVMTHRTFHEARVALRRNEPLGALQRYVLENYMIPEWLFDAWKEWAVDTDAVQANRYFWAMARTPRQCSVREMAAWIQKQGREVDGVPFVDNYGTVRTRDVQGLILFRSLNVTTDAAKGAAARENQIKINFAILTLLVTPFLYIDTLLCSEGLDVAETPAYENWPVDGVDDLSTKFVATRFAQMGVTVRLVDDAFDFALNYIETQIAGPRAGWDVGALVALRDNAMERMTKMERPSGLTEGCVLIPRVPGLPWGDADMNRVQEEGLFMENLPTRPAAGSKERGQVTCERTRPPNRRYAVPPMHPGDGAPTGPRGRGGHRGGGYGGRNGRGAGPGDRSLAGSMHAPRGGHQSFHTIPPCQRQQQQQIRQQQQALAAPSSSQYPPSFAPQQQLSQPSLPFTVPHAIQMVQQATATPTPPSSAPSTVSWQSINPNSTLTFGAIPARQNPTPTSVPQQITVDGRVYTMNAPPPPSNNQLSAPTTSSSFSPTSQSFGNSSTTTQYPYATVSPASINAANSGLVGVPMTEMFQALPVAQNDSMMPYDISGFGTNGEFNGA
ncbi:hypothetical protein C8R46DRAFT_1023791 [Mycena filopes]|nr:hypothetical protein C8R46DRAFT_1023791 [Mycena filopes]